MLNTARSVRDYNHDEEETASDWSDQQLVGSASLEEDEEMQDVIPKGSEEFLDEVDGDEVDSNDLGIRRKGICAGRRRTSCVFLVVVLVVGGSVMAFLGGSKMTTTSTNEEELQAPQDPFEAHRGHEVDKPPENHGPGHEPIEGHPPPNGGHPEPPNGGHHEPAGHHQNHPPGHEPIDAPIHPGIPGHNGGHHGKECFHSKMEVRAALNLPLKDIEEHSKYGQAPEWCFNKNITDFSHLFKDVDFHKLAHIGHWDVSHVEDMSFLFAGVEANVDISQWDVSRVTNMNHMFYNATLFNADISTWNVGKVTTMGTMFGLASSFDQDLGHWNVENVTHMGRMFSGSAQFKGHGLEFWNVERVTSMEAMFKGSRAFVGNLELWNTPNVVHMADMFHGCSLFSSNLQDWDVGNVRQMSQMFMKAKMFNSDVSQWNVDNVINFEGIFADASAFSQNVCSWREHIRPHANVGKMFVGSSCPKSLDIPELEDDQWTGSFCYEC